MLRIAPQQYEAVEGQHDEAIVTSVLKNDVNETGYVYTNSVSQVPYFCHHHLGNARSARQL